MKKTMFTKGCTIALTATMVLSMTAMPSTCLASQEEEGVHFPEVYTIDLLQPEEDDEVVEAKVEALLKTMTLEEKYSFIGGSGMGEQANAGDLPGVPRLGVPEILMYDGPGGVYYLTETTNPPQEEMLAASWDEEMAELWGEIYTKEAKAVGDGMMLSAQLDVQRNPQFRRTKDQLGADPYLISHLADDMVRGMQKEGGIAVLKHFVAYTEEQNNDVLTEQTLHELYLPPFESAVKDGGALGIMSSYNQINGIYASANTYTQNDVLRGMWGYKYFTITDWGGNHEFTLDKGTDIEMPSLVGNSLERLQARVALDQERKENPVERDRSVFGYVEDQWDNLESLSQEEADRLVDQAAGRVLRAFGKAGYLTLVEIDEDGFAKEEVGRTERIRQIDKETAVAQLNEVKEFSNTTSQIVAENGAVLLKNENSVLPLGGEDSVAVIGLTGMHLASGFGGERSYGTVSEMTSPYEALVDLLGEDKVTGAVYEDIIGTTIPEECLYTSADGEEHGVVRAYGTTGSVAGATEQQGQIFLTGNVPEKAMEGHEIGELAAIDPVLDYHVGTINGEPNQTYLIANADEGTATGFAYADDPAYTLDTWVEAPEDGDYLISFNNIGVIAKLAMYSPDESAVIAEFDNPSNRQNSQWYTSSVTNAYGMDIKNATVSLKAGERYHVTLQIASAVDNKDLQVNLSWTTPSQKQAQLEEALEAAKNNAKVLIFAYRATNSRNFKTMEEASMRLPSSQEEMIHTLAKAAHEAGNDVIVVLNNDGPVVMSEWKDEVDAILDMYYPGQKGGPATANLLTGAVNPSGKLAYTVPKSDYDTVITLNDEAFALYQAAANAKTGIKTTIYSEGINTDYKWFLEKGITPEYAFGYGMSYTTFDYQDLKVEKAPAEGETIGYDLTFTVTNTGDVAGSEICQVYLGKAEVPTGLQSSPLALAGFAKVKDLAPGESREVTIHVEERALSFWNTNTKTPAENGEKWEVATGVRSFYVGSSSDNLILSEDVDVQL